MGKSKKHRADGTVRVRMPIESTHRLRAMKILYNLTDAEVFSEALRLQERAFKKAKESEQAGGVVYLTVKYPDGRVEEERVFEVLNLFSE